MGILGGHYSAYHTKHLAKTKRNTLEFELLPTPGEIEFYRLNSAKLASCLQEKTHTHNTH